MINPKTLFELKGAWATFDQNHPRFKQFIVAARNNAIREDSIIEVTIRTPEGESICTNLKVTQSDMELFEKLKKLQ